MRRRLDLSKENCDPQFVGVTGIEGIKVVTIEDSAGDGIAFVIEVSTNAFPFAKRGELFVAQLSRDGLRLRRETVKGQWFLAVNNNGELVWKFGENQGLMSVCQRNDEFVFAPPKPEQRG